MHPMHIMNCSLQNMPKCLVLYTWFLSGNGLLFRPCFEALAELSSKDRKGSLFLIQVVLTTWYLVSGHILGYAAPWQDLLGRY